MLTAAQRIEEANYQADRRVRGAARDPWGRYDEQRRVIAVEVYDEETGDEETVDVPARLEVCCVCDGHGKHVNPSIDAGGLTAADFEADPGFRRDYFRGVYDVTCYTCHGRRVVPVIDEQRCDPAVLRALEDREADLAAYEAECAAERRMGA